MLHSVIVQMWEGDFCPTLFVQMLHCRKNGKHKKCASQRDNTGKITRFSLS
jgi:hypothetical protein